MEITKTDLREIAHAIKAVHNAEKTNSQFILTSTQHESLNKLYVMTGGNCSEIINNVTHDMYGGNVITDFFGKLFGSKKKLVTKEPTSQPQINNVTLESKQDVDDYLEQNGYTNHREFLYTHKNDNDVSQLAKSYNNTPYKSDVLKYLLEIQQANLKMGDSFDPNLGTEIDNLLKVKKL